MIRHGSVNIVTIHAKFIAMPHLGERRAVPPAAPDGGSARFCAVRTAGAGCVPLRIEHFAQLPSGRKMS
jgi:hypothetical protein